MNLAVRSQLSRLRTFVGRQIICEGLISGLVRSHLMIYRLIIVVTYSRDCDDAFGGSGVGRIAGIATFDTSVWTRERVRLRVRAPQYNLLALPPPPGRRGDEK